MHPEALRPLLDENGVLRLGALEPPEVERAFVVFAQRDDARFEPETWARHADRFFRTKLGISAEKRYRDAAPAHDVAGVVLAPSVPFRDAGGPTARLVYARPAEPTDLDAAEAADIRRGLGGLAALARRCRYVYLVEAEPDAGGTSASDRAGLLLAAILASVVLGPILTPGAEEIFGVKSARERLGL
jgi:hypothetical protein